MDDGNRLTVYELVERVIPCIIAKHYSENYIQGFRSTFRNLLAYCNKNEKKYFTAELAQQFMLDCYGVQPGTVERRCSRVHRAMDLLSDYQHFNAVMLRRRLNREFPAGLQEGAVNYLQKLSLHGRRENTLRSHRNVLLRFTDYLFSVGVTDYKLLSADIVNRYVKVVSCNYSNSVVRLHYSILLRFFQYLAHSGYKETDLSLKMMPIVKVSASARIPTTLDLSQIESILTSVDRESPQGKRDYAVLMIAVKLGIRTSDIRNKTNPDSPHIQQVNTALKQLRQEERLCRKIAEHSIEVQQHLTEARRDRAAQQQREQEHERDRRPNIDLTL